GERLMSEQPEPPTGQVPGDTPRPAPLSVSTVVKTTHPLPGVQETTAFQADPDAAVPLRDRLGRFEVHGAIGHGGMGAVLRGRDPALGRELALKVLLAGLHDNADALARFHEEAQIGGQLQHPGFVPVYELGADTDGRPFFAMKLVDGQTLAALLRERQ